MQEYRRFGRGRDPFMGYRGYGPEWSVSCWTHKRSKKEEIRDMEEYAENLKAELEEVDKKIKSVKKINS